MVHSGNSHAVYFAISVLIKMFLFALATGLFIRFVLRGRVRRWATWIALALLLLVVGYLAYGILWGADHVTG